MSTYRTFKVYNNDDFTSVTQGIQLAECMGCDDKSNRKYHYFFQLLTSRNKTPQLPPRPRRPET